MWTEHQDDEKRNISKAGDMSVKTRSKDRRHRPYAGLLLMVKTTTTTARAGTDGI